VLYSANVSIKFTFGLYNKDVTHYATIVDDYIHSLMRMFKANNQYSASQIWLERFKSHNVPITSVRRAITNLYNQGVVDKTPRMIDGIFGRPEHIYQYQLAHK